MDYHKQRIDRVRLALKKAEVDALLVTDFTNVTYLTGFTGDDSYLLVRRQGEVLLSDPRYTTQLAEECPGLELYIRPPGVSMWQAVVKVLRQAKIARLGVEAGSMTVGLQEKIVQRVKNLQITPLEDTVEKLRQIKDKQEIAAIRRAAWQAEKAFAAIRATLRPDKTENKSPTNWNTRCACSGRAGRRFLPSWASAPAQHCRMPLRASTALPKATSCSSTGGLTAACTIAT